MQLQREIIPAYSLNQHSRDAMSSLAVKRNGLRYAGEEHLGQELRECGGGGVIPGGGGGDF